MSLLENSSLGDHAVFINGDRGKNYPSKASFVDAGIPFINAGHLVKGSVSLDKMNYISHEVFTKLGSGKTQEGDILYCLRGSLGKVGIVRFQGDAAIASSLVIIRPKESCNVDYLLHFFRSPLGKAEIRRFDTGSSQPNLSAGSVKKYQIPLPPLEEQKRIAAILDAADELRAKRRESIQQLDELLQATFLDLFGDPVTNPKGIKRETLKSTFSFSTGKLDSNAAVENGTYPFFTCARETFAINEYAFDCEALLLAGNNANADYSVKHYKGKFNAYQRTYVINVDETLLTYEYARNALEYMLGDLKRFSKGTNTKYLTMTILNLMPILLPPLPLQQKFAEIVTLIEAQKSRYRAQLDELDTLFASLQSRAFKGEM